MDDVNGKARTMQRLLGAGGHGAQKGPEVLRFTGVGGVPSSLLAWTHVEGRLATRKPLMKRMLQLQANPLVQPLPELGLADPVAQDLHDLPAILRRIKEDWNEPAESLNRMSAFTLSSVLRARMRQRGDEQHDGSLDVGRGVRGQPGRRAVRIRPAPAFPHLSIERFSSNKLLAARPAPCHPVGLPPPLGYVQPA